MSVKRRKRPPVLYAAHSQFIDPIDCGSTISYKIVRRRTLFGEVELTDCNRKINWYFDDDDMSASKIDTAINVLEAFREQWLAARAKQVRRPRK